MSQALEFLSVYQNESRDLPVRVQMPDCLPFDLTGVTEIQARFRATDGLVYIKTLTNEGGLNFGVSVVGAPTAGRLSIALSPADTLALKMGERQDFTLAIYKGARAQVVSGGITFKAVDPGITGNNVVLSFDNVKTVQQVVDAYNASVFPEKEIYFLGSGATVLPVGTATLVGGTDQKRIVNYYRALSVLSPSI